MERTSTACALLVNQLPHFDEGIFNKLAVLLTLLVQFCLENLLAT